MPVSRRSLKMDNVKCKRQWDNFCKNGFFVLQKDKSNDLLQMWQAIRKSSTCKVSCLNLLYYSFKTL